jgi:hypothetical protein
MRIGRGFNGDSDSLVILSQDLGKNPQELLEHCIQTDTRLVIDTSELQTESQFGKELDQWLETISGLSSVLAPVLCLNFNGKEDTLFSNDKGEEIILKHWLSCLSPIKTQWKWIQSKIGSCAISSNLCYPSIILKFRADSGVDACRLLEQTSLWAGK